MSLRYIPVNLVCKADVIHHDGQDWLVTLKYKRWRGIKLRVKRFVHSAAEPWLSVKEQWLVFDDSHELVQIHDPAPSISPRRLLSW